MAEPEVHSITQPKSNPMFRMENYVISKNQSSPEKMFCVQIMAGRG